MAFGHVRGNDKALFSSCTRKKMPNIGVAIPINHPAISFKKWDQDLEGRLIAANLQIYNDELKIINVYMSRDSFMHPFYSHRIVCSHHSYISRPLGTNWCLASPVDSMIAWNLFWCGVALGYRVVV